MFSLMVTQITLGRATKDKPIDIDLSLEGPAWKISRKQGTVMRCCVTDASGCPCRCMLDPLLCPLAAGDCVTNLRVPFRLQELLN